MDKTDNLGFSGQFVLTARHDDGSVFAVRDIVNLIMDAGEDEVAKLISNGETAATAFDYIAIGTDSTAADDAQTQLGTDGTSEIATSGGTRAIDATPTTAANVATVDVTFAFTDGGIFAIKEVGLFNHLTPAGSDMLARQIFDVINVTSGDSLTATWNITCGVAR